MDLQALRIYVQVVETGSFTEGARLLFMAQSNASTAVRNLEREAGCPLLIRSKEGVRPTPEGQQLLDLARRILALADRATELGKKEKEPGGLLRIAAMESTAVVRLAPILRSFMEKYPAIRLQLKTGDTDRQLEWLKRGDVDFALPGERPGGSRFSASPIFQEKLAIAMRPLKRRSDSDGERLQSYLVLPPGCSFREKLEQILQKEGVKRIRTHEVGTVHTLYACVLAGMGSALFPLSFLDYHRAAERGLSIRRVAGKEGKLTIYGVWLTDFESSPVLKAWREFLSDIPDPADGPQKSDLAIPKQHLRRDA